MLTTFYFLQAFISVKYFFKQFYFEYSQKIKIFSPIDQQQLSNSLF